MAITSISKQAGAILALLALVSACEGLSIPSAQRTQADFKRIPFQTVAQEISFQSEDGTRLAGQLDRPPGLTNPPLVFIIHHSGPVDRDAYQYLAARLVPAGYAVFRFDKRGTGRSEGIYGCCEDRDALAAYRAAMAQDGIDRSCVFIIAQSIGTHILAQRFGEFVGIHRPAGVVLLSSLLPGEKILAIQAPLHIIISDSEPNQAALGEEAVKIHRAVYRYGASYFIAPHTEHTLFDISEGPIDWSDPDWPEKFSQDAWLSLLGWLNGRCASRGCQEHDTREMEGSPGSPAP
ncbi:MAG: lysophospholipase [Thermoflexus sp.]|uniref:alpha/beta hydrolase n=1 Tax=Thermoflexus sp. TaxID=1969742 RepID=UPI0025FAEFB4|nr:alpha/beta hydrolase [Thermoflexus sp.]MCS6964239.1 lysophospholipase [Thermoflexus sp.]MDW8186357.1 alpha/beta hydrolase [Anaerolineae bacterium]